ncbi:MAG TPA: rod shape-determining protein MreC [Chitinophagaceae bacterium]|nr:rod shape-determining protein MreC [Chitinophagaceae bacterium]
MRNIFLFIRRYFNFLLFLVLQGFCLFMVFNYNRFHNAVFMGIANEVTGKVYKQYNSVEYYFQLKKTNDSLVKANERLYNKLKQDFEMPDTVNKIAIDTIRIDSTEKYRKYQYMEAKVIGNSISLPNNYIQLNRGALQGVQKDMGVINVNNAVVGTVIDISNNFAVVMSLLHLQSNISAKLKNTGEVGNIVWDGKKPNIVLLKEIGKNAKVHKGDSVITSGFSEKFPYGLLIGTIDEIVEDKSTNIYTLKVRTAANFYNLEYVYIINNMQKDEPAELLKRVKKVNE